MNLFQIYISKSVTILRQFHNMGRLSKIDPNSYSESEKIITVHSCICWQVDFANTKLKGSVTHKFNVIERNLQRILLDVSDINVIKAVVICDDYEFPINYYISDTVPKIGSKLTLDLPEGVDPGELIVRLDYETSRNASGLQWLTLEQTLGKKHPYMFSQCALTHARSVIPCQDTPAIKFTYAATVEHPKELTALMSALIDDNSESGVTTFKQDVPIPAYLLAIVVGDLTSRPLGPNSNVWSEESIVDDCAKEFSDTCLMLNTAIDLCGPYVWKQYDLLVLPTSFPYGGMENPCLTFITPTLLAGDKSLADVIAHEIMHSWTGNLVTNKNFEHFWLNEGFTVFMESKIIGRLHGAQEQDFKVLRNLTELEEDLRTELANSPELTKLVVDLSNVSPDDAFSIVPYKKGSTFLRYIEEVLGGPEVFEPFLRSYFQKYAYKSIDTDDFKATLIEHFSQMPDKKEKLNEIDWDVWLHKAGMPPIIPKLDDTLAIVSKDLATIWGTKTNAQLKDDNAVRQTISTHQLIDFLTQLNETKKVVDLNEEKLDLIESTYSMKDTKNAEIRFRFLRLYIKAKLMSRIEKIFNFLNSNFRMKFSRPLYRDLGNWPEARPLAIKNYESVKSQMMAVCARNIEKDLGMHGNAFL